MTAYQYGAYNTIHSTETVDGFGCADGPTMNQVTIHRPTDTSKRFPLLSYGHGYSNGGDGLDGIQHIKDYATAGFVVVAHKSAESLFCWTTDD